jgi:EpsG family
MSINRNIIMLVWALPISLFLVLVNITFSKDQANYRVFFEVSQSIDWIDLKSYSVENGIEYLYLILNKIWILNFESFVFMLTYVAVSFKLIFFAAVQKLYKINKWYYICAYIAFIGLLNDAAQMRIALATGMYMLALKYYLENANFKCYALMICSVFFHTSMFILVFAFFAYKYLQFLYQPIVFILMYLIMQFFLMEHINKLLSIFLESSRYANYLDVGADQQNTTGLYQYFFLMASTIVVLHSWNSSVKISDSIQVPDAHSTYFMKFCNCSGYLAIYSLLVFSQSIAMSIRFAELFFIFYSIAVINTVKKSIKSKIIFMSLYFIGVIMMAIARFYHTHIYLNPILQ